MRGTASCPINVNPGHLFDIDFLHLFHLFLLLFLYVLCTTYSFAYTNTAESRIYRYRISHYNCIPRVLSLLTSNLSGCIPRQYLLMPFIITFIIYAPRSLPNVASRLSTISSIARCIYECFHLSCSQSRFQVRLPSPIHTYLGSPHYFLSFWFEKGEV